MTHVEREYWKQITSNLSGCKELALAIIANFPGINKPIHMIEQLTQELNKLKTENERLKEVLALLQNMRKIQEELSSILARFDSPDTQGIMDGQGIPIDNRDHPPVKSATEASNLYAQAEHLRESVTRLERQARECRMQAEILTQPR